MLKRIARGQFNKASSYTPNARFANFKLMEHGSATVVAKAWV
jgi:hypothetical protein